MTAPRGRTIRTFSDAASSYGRVGPSLFRHFAERLVEFSEVRGVADVLDVATGTGTVLLEAAERLSGGSRLVGIDVTEAMLTRAAAEVERRELAGVELRLMGAEELRFADASFACIFCAFAFSSFANKPKVIREFVRVLQPGGTVCISDAFGWYFDQDPRWSWHRLLLERFSELDKPSDRTAVPELLGLLSAHGLTNVTSTSEVYDLTFSDEDEWWAWSWSHGTRLLLDAVPAADRDAFRRAAAAEIRDLRARDGTITATIRATLTRAHKMG